ncbi:Hypothetical protein, putative [Bodo saltans]|uniref:Uncharacterized protein n=1 Tax=Bodo saltans TaxID=75058 RepID=A0A0S4IVP7_BODSA|nr:Hypothetical protein, putative [Bodo saltans]|eukprot:CUG03109.1 Hypothetical protein, putative [Bodo saltans]
MNLDDNRPASIRLPKDDAAKRNGTADFLQKTPSHIRIFRVGSVIASFYTETSLLGDPVTAQQTTPHADLSENESDDDSHDASSWEGPRGTVTELSSLIVSAVLAALHGGHLIGNSVKQFSIVWSAASVAAYEEMRNRGEHGRTTPATTKQQPPTSSASTFSTVIRETLLHLGSELLEGDGLWIRCDDNEGFRLKVALRQSTEHDDAITVIIPHAAKFDDEKMQKAIAATTTFHLLPSQNILWNAFVVPVSVQLEALIASTLQQWAPWTVDVIPANHCDMCPPIGDIVGVTKSDSDQALGGDQSPPNSAASSFVSGMNRVMPRSNSSLVLETPNTVGTKFSIASPPASPGMSRVPSRAFSVEALDMGDERIPHTPTSSVFRNRGRNARLARTALRCETHGSSAVVMLRVESDYTKFLESHVSSRAASSTTATVANCQTLTDLYHRLFQASNASVCEHGGSVSSISFAVVPHYAEQQQQNNNNDYLSDEIMAARVTLCVEVLCVLPRIELSRDIIHFSSICGEVAVSLVDAATTTVSDWQRTSILANQQTSRSAHFHVSSCLLQGRLLHSPSITGSSLAHRAEVDLVGGFVCERARFLLASAKEDNEFQRGGGDDDGGEVTSSCIQETPNSMRPEGHVMETTRQLPPAYRHLSSSLTNVVDGAPQALSEQHRHLASSLLQLKLRTSGLRILVGAEQAWRVVGNMVSRLLSQRPKERSTARPSHADSAAQPVVCLNTTTTSSLCLVVGEAKCGKTSFLLDCLIQLSVLPITLFLDGSCCRGSASAARRWSEEKHSPTSSTSGIACPLIMLMYLELNERISQATPSQHSEGFAKASSPSVAELVLAVKAQFHSMATQRKVLVLIIDDIHKMTHDKASISIISSIAKECCLPLAVIASTVDTTSIAGITAQVDDVATAYLDDNPLQDCCRVTTPCEEEGLTNTYKVLRQFVSTTVLGEALLGSSSGVEALPLRRLLSSVRRASCGSLIALASLGHDLKDRADLLTLTSTAQQPAGSNGIGLTPQEQDFLLVSRLEDRLVADVSNTFHHALCDHISVMKPQEASWLAAVVCYCAAMGEWDSGIPMHVAMLLYRISNAPKYLIGDESLNYEPIVISERSESDSMTNNSFLIEADASDAQNDSFDNVILARLSVKSRDTAASAAGLASLVRTCEDDPAKVFLLPFCIPRVVIRLMRSDVIAESCRRLASTMEWWYSGLPTHARCWLACMNGEIPIHDTHLADDIRVTLNAEGIGSSRICNTLRRHGYNHHQNSCATAGSSDQLSLQAPHGFGRGSDTVQAIVEVAAQSDRYGAVLAVLAASNGNRRKLRRTGRSAGVGLVTIVTRFHDIDVALEQLRYAWRAVDDASIKHAQRISHNNIPQRSESADGMPPTTSSFRTPLSVEGRWEGVVVHGSLFDAEEVSVQAVMNEVGESKARLRAVWEICKSLSTFMEQHPLAADPYDPPLRAAVLEVDRCVLQATGADGAETLASGIGDWQVSLQTLCETLAIRCKDLSSRMCSILSDIDLRRIRTKLEASVKCTVLRTALADIVSTLADVNQVRRKLESTDTSKTAQAQQLEGVIAAKVHNIRQKLISVVLLASSVARMSQTLSSGGHRHVDVVMHQATSPTSAERIHDRFMTEVTQRYISSVSSLADHVHSSRAALVQDFLTLTISFVTTFAAVTIDTCVAKRVSEAVGDVSPCNLETCTVTQEANGWSISVEKSVVAQEQSAAAAKPSLISSTGRWQRKGAK